MDVGRLSRLTELELPWCVRCNQVRNLQAIRLFSTVSRLADGYVWVGILFVLLMVEGLAVWQVMARGLIVALLGVVSYKLLKIKTARARPFEASPSIRLLATPLDQYSFPSGHTLYAVAFSLIMIHSYPALVWILAPFAVLVALSRIILGLHYPSDVAAGAVLGTALAFFSLQFF